MIELSNGHQFEYMAASGALAYDGRGWPWEKPLVWTGNIKPELFTVVTKTLTREPRKGNLKWTWPRSAMRHLPDGELNAVGLSNPGIQWWLRTHGKNVNHRKLPLVVSIFSESLGDLAMMADMLNGIDIVGIELNASCPNTEEQIFDDPILVVAAARAIQTNTRHPLIVKLAPAQNIERMATLLADMPEAYAINSVLWHSVYPNQDSPLKQLGSGAVSGGAAQKWTWEALSTLTQGGSVPVIGPSVWGYEDIARLRELGARAISFGSVFIRRPWAPTKWIERDRREQEGSCE